MINLTFQIIWTILAVLGLILLYVIARKFAKIMNSKNLMERDIEMYKMKFSEQEIITHLDFIMTEYLDYYVTMYITPKQVYYINKSMEDEMVKTLSEVIPTRISPTLYSQLSLIYDPSQIPKVIGEKLYLKMLEYVIEFNVQNEYKQKK